MVAAKLLFVHFPITGNYQGDHSGLVADWGATINQVRQAEGSSSFTPLTCSTARASAVRREISARSFSASSASLVAMPLRRVSSFAQSGAAGKTCDTEKARLTQAILLI